MASSSSSSSSTKRKRNTGGVRPPDAPNPRLSGFPDVLLAGVASYLPQTSCVSLSMAMTPNTATISRQPSATARTIVAQRTWDSLDFEDIVQICQRGLTDDDVRWVLECIDAVNTVKTLKLTNCFEITGSGLEPLRGSLVLKQIDLSLADEHEDQAFETETAISEATVVPILDSIIGTEGNSLMQVQLPKKWREEKSDLLTHFLERYNTALGERRIPCSRASCQKQGRICEGTLVHSDQLEEVPHYGLTGITCYHCMDNFCSDCFDGRDIGLCKCCEKCYCNKCNEIGYCATCPNASCKSCDNVKFCHGCNEGACRGCITTSISCQYCDTHYCEECNSEGQPEGMNICQGHGCYRTNCSDCVARDWERAKYDVYHCQSKSSHACDCTFCLDCRAKECNMRKSCRDCMAYVAPLLARQNQRLLRENEMLKLGLS